MKTLLSLALLTCLSLCAQCLDLTLNNGRVYRDVSIINKLPDGVDIVSHQDNDITVIRHVRYNEMSPDTLAKFPDYDKQKSDAYITSLSASHEKAVAKNAVAYTQWTKDTGGGNQVVYPVASASSIRVVFKATKDMEHGTIGWASSEESDEHVQQFGKIYIHGLSITEGNEWVGTVYLTNKNKSDRYETCPCYALDAATAEKIDKRAR
jgi:hypothetical protein